VLPRDLLRPETWPEPRPGAVELIQTHVSWVLRGEREVLKVKKPVSLGFLDFGTPELRRAACEEEVRLNARLAPDVYMGVVPIVERPDGSVAIGGSGRTIDWAVHMRRLNDADRADVMLSESRLQPAQLDRLATTIAAFHDRAGVDATVAAQWASPEAVRRNVEENFEQTRTSAPAHVPAEVVSEASQRQKLFLDGSRDLLSSRVARGRIRDGHGDLRLEHVYFEGDGVRIIDCIEFDPRYRIEDTCADVAFLAMDLQSRGRADLAEHWLGRYARAAADPELYALVDFYAGYRAWVRGKVSALLAADEQAPEEVRDRAAQDARSHFLLALATGRPLALPPTLVCVGGLIAAGKSTIADALADELSCPVIDADRTRKHLLGVPETRPLDDPAWSGAYDVSVSDRVYAELLRLAEVVLATGRSVILDASFRSAALRRSARALARARGVPFRFIECRATRDACRHRLEERESVRGPSDGRLAIFDDFAARWEPVVEVPASEHVVLDTTRPVSESLEAVRARVATWPLGLVG
jgi:aminoglycoside phosphotransferase family enzyme/predicted kinase